ncbi:hypothetical protein P8452_09580 [Trifolium repens]|nr:hypothetical protein P8452_09580 [Trifolium repens]
MKPHIHVSGESSSANEFRKPIGEKLHPVDEVDMMTINCDTSKQGRAQTYHQIDRRRWSHRAEDPIRTLMFLGSWNHT